MPYDFCVKTIPTLTYDEQLSLMAVLVASLQVSRPRQVTEKKDCRNSYPEGYFNLFGSAPDFPDEPDDPPPDDKDLEGMF